MAASISVELLLLRHGIAAARVAGLDHPDRALTQRGRERSRAVLKALVRRGLQLDRLISSPLLRARETAAIAQEVGLAPSLSLDERLRPGGQLGDLIEGLQESVVLVGHEPDLSASACRLLDLSPGRLALRKVGVVHLRCLDGTWTLQALLRPRLILDTSA